MSIIAPGVAALNEIDRVHAGIVAGKDAEIAALKEQLALLQPKPDILWGSSVEARGLTWANAFARVEASMRPLDIVRIFHSPGQGPKFPTQMSLLAPRSAVYSFKFSPLRVLSGAADIPFVTLMRAAGDYASNNPKSKFYWTLEHEGDADIRKGGYSAADYVSAWGRLLGLAKGSHERVLSCNIFTKYALEPAAKFNVEAAIHPDVDVLAWDPYKWTTATTIPSMFDPIVDFSKRLGKPWGIAEVGVSSRNPNAGQAAHTTEQKMAALKHIPEYLKKCNPTPEFVCYFNSDPGTPESGWDWPIDAADLYPFANAWKAGRDS